MCQSGVTNFGLSEHMLTYCTRKVRKKSCVYQHDYVNLRSIKNYTKEAFEIELLREDWHDVYIVTAMSMRHGYISRVNSYQFWTK